MVKDNIIDEIIELLSEIIIDCISKERNRDNLDETENL